MTRPKPNGRKYFLTKVGLGLTAAPVAGIFALAGAGKVTTDVTTLLAAALPPYYLAVGVLVSGFNAANAYTTGKAADNNLVGEGG